MATAPDPVPPAGGDAAHDPAGDAPSSLLEGVQALVEDARLYLEAELNFQKSRAAFVGGQVKTGAILALSGLFLVMLALMALVLGLVLGLAPLLGPWGAMAAVVLALLLCAGLAVWRAAAVFKAMQAALKEEQAEKDHG